jgi:putative secretion ATPase (PEP-CTERM system associated)
MLLEHYGFREHPFQMTPDARLFFASSVHRRAYAHLTFGIAQREGFIIITGEVGAGKTTIVERLCNELDPASFTIARIVTTQVSGEDLLRLVADAFGATMEGSKAAVLKGISEALRAGAKEGRRHLLIVDEAQGLAPLALEELRMLSNVTEGGQALLQTILLGQPELKQTIASPSLDQLRQRVLASFHLAGLSRDEVHAYVEHRLRAVGWDGRPSWEPAALDAVHRRTGGIPRRINRLCSRVLLSAALEETDRITLEMVEQTAQELEEDLGGSRVSSASAAAAAAAVVIGAGRNGPLPYDDGRYQGYVPPSEVMQLTQRIEALERLTQRRERVFNQLMDLFADLGGRRR